MAQRQDVGLMGQGFWVLGTDTGVGKTKVAAGLVHALAACGAPVAGIKPVVSGAVALSDGPRVQQVWEDVLALEEAGGLPLSLSERCVLTFRAPASPHFAAQEEGQAVRLDALVEEVRKRILPGRVTVVEGVGGLRVPVGAGFDMADVVVASGLPVVLVVGLRLGCINHALLTAEAVVGRGVPLLGWIANAGIDVGYERGEQTLATITGSLGLACAGLIPRLPGLPPLTDVIGLTAYRAGLRHQAGLAGKALAEAASRYVASGSFAV